MIGVCSSDITAICENLTIPHGYATLVAKTRQPLS